MNGDFERAKAYPFVEDPEPERIKTLIYATPPVEYVADTAHRWVEMGFSGFIRPDVMRGWESDIWSSNAKARIVGEANASLKTWRSANRRMRRAGLTDNLISVAFSKHLPDWFDDDAWAEVVENFRQGARFAKMAGFTGLALDDEYIEEMWGLHWAPYLKQGYPRKRLPSQARLRGRQIQEAMLAEYPDMVTAHLPESYSIHGELSRQMFLGFLDALAKADSPGGMHIFTESTYFQTSADLMVLRYAYGLDRLLLDRLESRLADYWRRRCSVAPGLAPLGYLRPIRDERGKRLGFGGRKEIFGDRLLEAGEDKGGNYPPFVFQATYSAARMASRRYVWIYSSGPSWWRMTEDELSRYGGPWTQTVNLADDFDEYVGALRKPKIIDTEEFLSVQRATRVCARIDTLKGLGIPPGYWVLGPFPNEGGSGFDRDDQPEGRIDLEAEYEGISEPVKWRKVETPPTGYMDLSRLIAGGVEIQGYAFTRLEAEKETEAVVRFGCDDSGKIWLNHELIFALNSERRAMPDEDMIPVTLPAGPSSILIKVGNYRGGWGFYLRVTDGEGKEVPGIRWS